VVDQVAETVVLVEVRSLMWKDQVIVPAGYRFVNCRFDGCTFVGKGGEFINCEINTHLLPEFNGQLYRAMLSWREIDLGDVDYASAVAEVRQMQGIYEAIRRVFVSKVKQAQVLSFHEQITLKMKRAEFEAWFFPPMVTEQMIAFEDGHYLNPVTEGAWREWLNNNAYKAIH
jgi:hypothetical protein